MWTSEIEDNYVKHSLGSRSYIIGKSDGEFDQMKRYFMADKLGLKEIEYPIRKPYVGN